MTWRVRSTHEVDYNGELLARAWQPHLSRDIVFNAWIEDDVATWPTPDLAAQAALEMFDPDDFEVESAAGPARPPLVVEYVCIVHHDDRVHG